MEKELEASKEALAKERDANRVAAQKKEEELLAKNKLAQAALQKQIKDLQVSLTAAKGSASKANAAKIAAVAKERDANRVAAQKKEEELLAKNKLAQAALQKQVADLQVSLTAEKDSASKANAAKIAAVAKERDANRVAVQKKEEELLAKNKLAQAALQKQVADLQVSLTAEKDSASRRAKERGRTVGQEQTRASCVSKASSRLAVDRRERQRKSQRKKTSSNENWPSCQKSKRRKRK